MLEERNIYLEKSLNTKANGFYERKLNTMLGEIPNLEIPRTRDSLFSSDLLPKLKTEDSLALLISDLYSAGISTRKIEELLINRFGVSLSHSSVSRIASVAYEEVQQWKTRTLKNYSVIFIDAFYFPLKRETVEKEAVYVALGIDQEGQREVIDFWIPGGAEGASNWEEIFHELRFRGVTEVDYIVADGLTGISQAIDKVFPDAKYQYCVLHACRTSLNKCRATDKKQIATDLKTIYFANSKEEAKIALNAFIEKWKRCYPKITGFWEANFTNLTSFMSLPNKLWGYVYTTNWVERLHKEIKRRIKSMEQFQNEQSASNLLYVLYRDRNDKYKRNGVNGWKDLYKQFKKINNN
jgi:putative transposase